MPRLTRPALLSTLLLALFTQGAQAATVTRTSGYQYEAATGLLAKELVEASNNNLCLVKTYTYDGYGNRNGGTTRNCNGSSGEAAAPSGAAVIVPRTTGATYDATGRFPQTISNALSQTETRVNSMRKSTLIKDNRFLSVRRHLRRVYVDPMTGGAEWGLVTAPEGGIMGAFSSSSAGPIKRDNFSEEEKEFVGKTRYSEWQFVYRPATDLGKAKAVR